MTKVASGCQTNGSTFVVSLTWEIQGTQFPADSSISIVFSTDGQYAGVCIFPGMTVTSLLPRETLTLVKQIPLQYNGNMHINGNSWTRSRVVIQQCIDSIYLSINSSYFVPAHAIPYSTAIDISSTSTTSANFTGIGPPSLSTDGKVTLIASLTLGIPTLIVTGFGVWLAWRKENRDRAKAKFRQLRQMI